MSKFDSKTISRFWSKVDVGNTKKCWPWKTSNKGKYGSFYYDGADISAHRMAFLITKGEIASGLHVLHSCDNPLCCNPCHLRLGTNNENMADKLMRGRQPLGEKVSSSKLKQSQVEYMKLLLQHGWPVRHVAGCYGVSTQHVYMIRDGKWWGHVGPAKLRPFVIGAGREN